jgi:hypothetical protein
MVATDTPAGLIATVRTATTPTLDGVASCCGWPVLLEASPRRLDRELSTANPECVLFWLDDGDGVDATARLIAWLRQRGARPLRIAAALDADGAVESTLRSAGAHGFLPVNGQSACLIAEALGPLLAGAVRNTVAHARRGPIAATGPVIADHARPP